MNNHMIVYGEFNAEYIADRIGPNVDPFEWNSPVGEVKGRLGTDSMRLMKTSRTCVICGLQGTIARLETHEIGVRPHFNFYGDRNGELILMTKDHIIPRAAGGKDTVSNYQTMCSRCNGMKGCLNISNHELKKLVKATEHDMSTM